MLRQAELWGQLCVSDCVEVHLPSDVDMLRHVTARIERLCSAVVVCEECVDHHCA
eukprot:m.260048 g.260048  ORF g.260048 m.260048 type:complete len:55 (+) comp38005_c0_seq1:348-512(+)